MANVAWPAAAFPRWRAAAVALLLLAVAFWLLPWGRFAFGMFLFSRIRRTEVLAHGTRQSILARLAARPGLTLQALQAELGVAWGTAVHHVHLLERHGQVVSVRQGPRRLLYAAGSPEARMRSELAVLRSGTAHAIAQAVLARPGTQQAELCRLLGLRSPSASKHLARLAAAGLVEVERTGAGCRYRPTARLRTALDLRSGAHPGVAASRPPRPLPMHVRADPARHAPHALAGTVGSLL